MLISLRRRLSSSSRLYDPLRLITSIGFYTLACIPKDKRNFKGESTMTFMTALLKHFHEYYGLSTVSFDCKSQVTHSQNKEIQSPCLLPCNWLVRASLQLWTHFFPDNTCILRSSSPRGEKNLHGSLCTDLLNKWVLWHFIEESTDAIIEKRYL